MYGWIASGSLHGRSFSNFFFFFNGTIQTRTPRQLITITAGLEHKIDIKIAIKINEWLVATINVSCQITGFVATCADRLK